MMNADDRLKPIRDISPEERNLRAALGRRIRQSRKRRGWTQADLALQIGAKRLDLVRWEGGQLPPVHALIRLSEALGTSLDALIAGRSAPEEDALTKDQKKRAAQHLTQLAGLLQLRAGGARK